MHLQRHMSYKFAPNLFKISQEMFSQQYHLINTASNRFGESFYPIIYLKGESEIKEESLDLKEEDEENGERDVDEICGLAESQLIVSFINYKTNQSTRSFPRKKRKDRHLECYHCHAGFHFMRNIAVTAYDMTACMAMHFQILFQIIKEPYWDVRLIKIQ
ncbi:hypothetical protein Anas_12655 [Armadillidium nasatum]|uniref:Uncharacterized protein n=1 Tax=Armadillidium nasatum TaxID=96803 RepID=A0A5N5T9G2_9CRUS|nr:hypothetical protein Anas_12655 [Armadillidium nasatum]